MQYNLYNLTALLGLISGFSLVIYLWDRSENSRKDAALLLSCGAPFIFLGAKVGFLFQSGHSVRSFNTGHGYSLYGAFFAVLLFWLLVRWFWKFPLLHFLDCVTPAAAIGLIFARIGCFFHGCCGGTPSDLPWSVTFPRGATVYSQQLAEGIITLSRTTSLPVHPTQIYEAILGTLVLFLGLWLLGRNLKPGFVFGCGMLIYSAYRLTFEGLRFDYTATIAGVFNLNQVFSLFLVIASLILLAVIVLKNRVKQTPDFQNQSV